MWHLVVVIPAQAYCNISLPPIRSNESKRRVVIIAHMRLQKALEMRAWI